MVLEYTAHDAQSDAARGGARALGTAVISRGLEDHASSSARAAHATTAATASYRTVLACELISAVRAQAMSGAQSPAAPVREALRPARSTSPMIRGSHPPTGGITAGEGLLTALAGL